MRKKAKKIVPREAKRYTKQLQKEINEDREKHGKKPFDFDDNPPQEEKESTVSTTDPDSGVFVKGEHKRCFAYEAHTACNKYGIILGVHVTAGNIHDSVAFEALYDILNVRFPDHALVVADSAYKTPAICKRIIDSGRVLLAPYTRPKGRKGGLRQRDFVHDEYFDDIICPAYRTLHYVTTNRDGYREYRSRPYICRDCELLSQCTANAKCEKTVVRHLWADYVEQTEEYRYTALHKKWYGRRKETIERVFADAKEKHAMRFTPYRGLAQVTNWVKLKFAAMNLKKLALWLTREGENSPLFVQNLLRWLNFIENTKKGQSGNSEIALFWHQKRTFAQEQGLRYIPGSCAKAFFVWFICFKAQEIHLVISAGVFWVRLRSYLKFLHIFRFVHEESDDIYSCSGLWYRA